MYGETCMLETIRGSSGADIGKSVRIGGRKSKKTQKLSFPWPEALALYTFLSGSDIQLTNKVPFEKQR